MNKIWLKAEIIQSLRQQGFLVRGNRLVCPSDLDKSRIRELHSAAVAHIVEKYKKGLVRFENNLLQRIACGYQVDPEAIRPKLTEVLPDSEDELLFRYVRLHWSIPVSAGYGRRLRFLVEDQSNGKLIGIIGLADPVFSLKARDQWIGWGHVERRKRLRNILDAFVLGAVPPYSTLVCGKLVAAIAACAEVRMAFRKKYAGRKSLIDRREDDGRIALITTTSALGRSSMYNRLRFNDRPLYISVGFTQGSGDFHFTNGLYEAISRYAARWCEPTAKSSQWGAGFRNRREVVRKCLRKIGITADWQYHGIRREIFVVPLAKNTREFLRGEHDRLLWYPHTIEDIWTWFRQRWLIPRAMRNPQYQLFDRESYRLWQ